MSNADKGSDIERLLAEAEGVLGDSPPAVVPRADLEPSSRPLSKTVQIAAFAGGAAAVIIFLLFLLLPFLGAPSGAAAAFISTFITVVVMRRRTP